MGLLAELNEIMFGKYLEQYMHIIVRAQKWSIKTMQAQWVTSSPPSSTRVHDPDAGPEEDGFRSLGFMWHRNSARFLKDKCNHSNHKQRMPTHVPSGSSTHPEEESDMDPIFKWFKLVSKN